MSPLPLFMPPLWRPWMLRLSVVLLVAWVLAGLLGASPAAASSTEATPPARSTERAALRLHVEGPIGPATADYVRRGLEEAAAAGAPFVILRLDTPGGLDTSMRSIVQDILASPVPVIGYVAPSGARAASAGTYILYATHVAAMAAGTTLGAATPVELGGGGPGAPRGDESPDDARERTALERKIVEDAVAYLVGLAELRGRDVEFAEAAVRRGTSASSNAALSRGVVDVVANDEEALKDAIDGMRVLVHGTPTTIAASGVPIEDVALDWRERLLSYLTNPNLALLLLMLGVYGILFELASPGLVVPGVAGVVMVALGLYGLHVLPLSLVGVGLCLLGVVLLVAEVFVPSFGVLGFAGLAALLVGGALLVDTEVPAFQVSIPVLAAVAGVGGLFVVLAMRMALRARRRRVVSGTEALVGRHAMTLDGWRETEGWVRVAGERWQAFSDVPLAPGVPVVVTAVEDLWLTVRPLDPDLQNLPDPRWAGQAT